MNETWHDSYWNSSVSVTIVWTSSMRERSESARQQHWISGYALQSGAPHCDEDCYDEDEDSLSDEADSDDLDDLYDEEDEDDDVDEEEVVEDEVVVRSGRAVARRSTR